MAGEPRVGLVRKCLTQSAHTASPIAPSATANAKQNNATYVWSAIDRSLITLSNQKADRC